MKTLSFSIDNYRSFFESQNVEMKEKCLIITGQNNAGKSNILRASTLIYNDYDVGDFVDLSYDLHDKNKGYIGFSLFADNDSAVMRSLSSRSNTFANFFSQNAPIEIPYTISHHQIALDTDKLSKNLDRIIDQGADLYISRDINAGYSDRAYNIIAIAGRLDIRREKIIGTIYVPAFRHITQPGTPLHSFNAHRIPGQTISPENIVTTLQGFDRPSAGRLSDKQKMRSIESFLSHCLDERMSIEVVNDRSAIYIITSYGQHDLRSLGSGIEQLLIIGTAGVGFEDKLVLIEEPELHLHPRVQRRMIDYFRERTSNRFMITTHSASIVDSGTADVIHVRYDGHKSHVSSLAVRAHLGSLAS